MKTKKREKMNEEDIKREIEKYYTPN